MEAGLTASDSAQPPVRILADLIESWGDLASFSWLDFWTDVWIKPDDGFASPDAREGISQEWGRLNRACQVVMERFSVTDWTAVPAVELVEYLKQSIWIQRGAWSLPLVEESSRLRWPIFFDGLLRKGLVDGAKGRVANPLEYATKAAVALYAGPLAWREIQRRGAGTTEYDAAILLLCWELEASGLEGRALDENAKTAEARLADALRRALKMEHLFMLKTRHGIEEGDVLGLAKVTAKEGWGRKKDPKDPFWKLSQVVAAEAGSIVETVRRDLINLTTKRKESLNVEFHGKPEEHPDRADQGREGYQGAGGRRTPLHRPVDLSLRADPIARRLLDVIEKHHPQTDREMAKLLGVTDRTLRNWKAKLKKKLGA